MRITIYSIRAKIIDVSTNTEDDYLISKWIVKYGVDLRNGHFVRGDWELEVLPNMELLLNTIKRFYDSPSLTK